MHLPPALSPGARIALVSPAGPLRSAAELHAASAQVRSFGWEPAVAPNALAKHEYLAGSDIERISDITDAIRDDSIDAIWCLRGGYGAIRLLGEIDLSPLRERPKALIGYSDITALHAVAGREGIISFHGPTARAPMDEFSRASFTNALVARTNPCGRAANAHVIRPGRATGRLTGGNLALLAALAGTPYAPDYSGAILVIEDVGEAVYRIDRMLRQLMLSGATRSLRGIAIGQFTDHGDEHAGHLEHLMREFADAAGVPAIHGIPMGHIDSQWTIPLGAQAELDADACTLDVIFE